MMTDFLSLNYGQQILFSYSCISLTGSGKNLKQEDYVSLMDLIIELTDESNYESIEETPDFLIMTQPQKSFEIFCDFFDENENYIMDLINL